jgi:hypothetical protein
MNSNKKSAGLVFMAAAKAAMPRTLGDRERISAMDTAMGLAVRNRFAFEPEDVQELRSMRIETCVGVFRPLDLLFYRMACHAGGTYARMYEQYLGLKPWRAGKAIFPAFQHDDSVHENVRVCAGVAVLMPPTFSLEEPELASHKGLQVWWVTDSTATTINLCRYKPAEGHKGEFRHPGGTPARRRQLTHEEWDIFQTALKVFEGDGDPLHHKWTADDDKKSWHHGWFIIRNELGRGIKAVPGIAKGFATDVAALEFVRKEAAKGDALSVKALLVHERYFTLPDPEQTQAKAEDCEALTV